MIIVNYVHVFVKVEFRIIWQRDAHNKFDMVYFYVLFATIELCIICIDPAVSHKLVSLLH
jgi:hypothetical protein